MKLTGPILLSCCLVLGVAYAESQARVLTVYGIENAKQTQINGHSNASYILQIASFKNRIEAVKCRRQYLGKINQEVRVISPQNGRGIYAVVVGPFDNLLALKEAAQQLGSTYEVQQAAIKPLEDKKTLPIVSSAIQGTSSPELKRPATPKLALSVPSNEAKEKPLNPAVEAKKAMTIVQEDQYHAIENRMFSLRYNLLLIDNRLKRETDAKTIAALEKQRLDLNRELDMIVATVIKRVNQG